MFKLIAASLGLAFVFAFASAERGAAAPQGGSVIEAQRASF